MFAARYQIRRERERFVTDVDNILEKTTYYLHPDRYKHLFAEKLAAVAHQPLTMAGRPVEEVVEDLDEYDRYFARMEEKRVMTGGEVLSMSDDEGWQ